MQYGKHIPLENNFSGKHAIALKPSEEPHIGTA
jgi:hypothetical protein